MKRGTVGLKCLALGSGDSRDAVIRTDKLTLCLQADLMPDGSLHIDARLVYDESTFAQIKLEPLKLGVDVTVKNAP